MRIRCAWRDEVDEGEHEVEAILKHKGKGKARRYLVHWKGYPKGESTWQTTEDVGESLLEEYHASLPAARARATRALAEPPDSDAEDNVPLANLLKRPVPLPPVPPRTTTVLEAGTTELRVDGAEGGKMNGAFVMEWDEVQVLATNDLGFSWIKVGRKKGWLRSEYLQQDE